MSTKTFSLLSVLVLSFAIPQHVWAASAYMQTNLVSDMPGVAAVTDPNLVDPWGVSFSPTSPLWVSDRGTGVSTLYNGVGAINPLVVTVPPGTAATGPTGQVFAGGTNFRLNGNAVNFIFATLAGTIDAWNGGTSATVVATTPGASFTGLAIGNNMLFAANFAAGTINVFDSSFAPATLAGNFADSNLPAGYSPFNVQTLNGRLYVEYGKMTAGVPVATPGGGFVDVFDFNGNLVQRLISNGSLDAPWGVTLAPSGFGSFGGDLLVGNFGNGQINAFDPATGAFLGALTDATGKTITNDGLWTITFDLPNGAPGALNPNELFFTAGLNGGRDGLLGAITPTPEPGAIGLVALGIFGFSAVLVRRGTRS